MPAQPTLDRAAARSLLDAVHGQPAVQGEPAPARARRGHALLDAGRPPDPRRRRGPVVRATPATAAARSPRPSSRQIAEMDYAPPFQMGHPGRVRARHEVVRWLPGGLDHVFFTNSGSESVDTALKIALAYHRVRGEGTRTRLIGRERGYHGVGFGGISVGGMVNNRKFFGAMLPGVDHLPHTHDLEHNAFSRGQPAVGRAPRRRARAHRRAARRDQHRRRDRRAGGGLDRRADAAQGLPAAPARDLHEARHPADLRRGDHRLRPPRRAVRRGALRRDARHDHLAKGLTNGAVPMGAVVASRQIYDAFMHGPGGRHRAVPRLHLLGAPAGLRGRPRHAGDLPDARGC